MFFHILKYTYKSILRSKENIFWSFLFPIILATLMYAAFGNIQETTETFNAIPVAIVENKTNDAFSEVLDSLSKEGADQMIEPSYLEENDALKSLEEKEIDGIIYVDDTVELTVRSSGINETILNLIIDEYLQMESTITAIAKTNPEGIPAALESINDDVSYYRSISTSDGNQDNLVNYFYAVFAMSCLFASFTAVNRTIRFQANMSALAQRRAVSPTHKLVTILAEFCAMLSIQFAIEVISFMYMWKILGINFGTKILAIFPVLLLGSAIGIALGILIGSFPKPTTEGGKIGVAVSISMILSVMADLCAHGVKNLIEHTVPIINRINPAALISDSFYALNVYDDYSRYTGNMIILGIITFVLCLISYLMIRRNRYASL